MEHRELMPMARDAFHQFARNGVWGTCGNCPRTDDGHAYPEFCAHRDRSDHRLNLDSLREVYVKLRRG